MVNWHCHLEVHDGATQQSDTQKGGTCHLEDFNFPVLIHVGHEHDSAEHARDRDAQQSDSEQNKYFIGLWKIFQNINNGFDRKSC